MGSPAREPALVGARYDDDARLPPGLQLESVAAVGGSGDTVVSATRGEALVILLSRDNAIVDALELRTPCARLVLEARTCDFNGEPDPRVVALMDERYQCGGHRESSPARAWRVQGGRLVEVDPARVTCGSLSCEVDRPVR